MCADEEKFYLVTPLDRPQYTRIPVELVPQEFTDANKLASQIKNGYIYMKIIRGICGLPQASVLANKLLKKQRLEKHDYYKVDPTPGRFTHKTCPIWCTLVVDDFGVKYIGRQHAEHLMSILKQHYDMEEDWKGELYCGITLKWNYAEGYVDIAMPNYVGKTTCKIQA